MSEEARSTEAVAVVKTYDLILWLYPKIEKYPRSHKFTLGDRTASLALDLLLLLVEAAHAKQKLALLREASARVNALRYVLRLAKDLHLLAHASYEHATERLDEIGRMIGGWLKNAAVRV